MGMWRLRGNPARGGCPAGAAGVECRASARPSRTGDLSRSCYRPDPPPRLIFITDGYEDNLAVPHDVAGERGAAAVREWVEAYNAGASGPTEKKIAVEQVEGVDATSIADAFPVQGWGLSKAP